MIVSSEQDKKWKYRSKLQIVSEVTEESKPGLFSQLEFLWLIFPLKDPGVAKFNNNAAGAKENSSSISSVAKLIKYVCNSK